jgi:tRNA threonylcarbamoyladenosine biosynthesis protein TsaE
VGVETANLVSGSEEETIVIGETIGHACRGGEMIGLIGPLGAGKSVLTRGIARGLGIDAAVRSPSFNLMREYKGRLVLRHWDLFRLDSGFESLGLLESVDDDALVVVEWAEKWNTLERYMTGSIFMIYGDAETVRIINWTGHVPGLNVTRD